MINSLINKYKQIPIAVKAALWFMICTMLQKCISLVTVPIFTRIMSAEDYGVYSTYLAWYSIITVICTLNMHRCIYVNGIAKSKSKEDKNKLAISILSLATTITAFMFVFYLIFHKVLNTVIGLPTIVVIFMFIQILFEPPVSLWLTKQRFEYKYMQTVAVTIGMVILNSVLGILFVLFATANKGMYRVLSITLVQVFFGGIIYIYFIIKGKKIFSIDDWKHFLIVELPLLPHELSLQLLGSSDRIMITSMVSKATSAIYSVAYSAGQIISLLKTSIIDAIRPWMYKKIQEKDFESIKNTNNMIFIFVFLLSLVFIALAPEIIIIMAPKEYYEAIYVIPPVAASSFFTYLYGIFSQISMYFEKTNKIMIASICSSVLNIVLNIIFIPIFGFLAAGYTTLVCYMFLALFHYIIMRKICINEFGKYETFDDKFILFMSVLVIISAILFSLVYKNTLVRYITLLILLVIIFINKNKFINMFKNIKEK